MGTPAFAQASQVNAAYASDPDVAPTTGWQQLLVNPGGTQNFTEEAVEVVANPQDPSMVKQLGERVGGNTNPTLVMDWSKLVAHTFGRSLLRSAPKAPWGQSPLRPTAFVDGGGSADSITVAGAATLPAGTIIVVLGSQFNDGLYVLGSGSNATTLNVPTGTFVAETVSPTGSVLVEIVGFEFTTADLSVNSSGNIASSSQALTAFALEPGHRVYFRASSHATSLPSGGGVDAGLHYATIASTVTTNLMTLKDRTFPVAAISGTGKTVRLYFGTLFRNVPFGHADYLITPAMWLELIDPQVGAAGASVYSYAEKAVLNNISMGFSGESKIEATLAFMCGGFDGENEAADRISGASTAFRPVGTSLFHTACSSMLVWRIVANDDDTELVGAITAGTFSIAHNVSMTPLIGECLKSVAFGDIDPSLTGLSWPYEDAEQRRAITSRRICRAEMLMWNGNGAIAIDMPTGRLTGGNKDYPENSAINVNASFVPHGDPLNGNIVCAINVLGYIPTADPS
jgi:hypothetical protein